MDNFNVRVVLHDRAAGDYQILHEQMANRGFSRSIREAEGDFYHLPPAEYFIRGSYSPEDVLELARLAAAETGRACSVRVTPFTETIWFNLPPAA